MFNSTFNTFPFADIRHASNKTWRSIAGMPSFDPREAHYKVEDVSESVIELSQSLINLSESLGDLALKDIIENSDIADQAIQIAKLGDTIMEGGYIKTNLLEVDVILGEDAIFKGDVVVGGDLLVGGDGLLSVFQFVSAGHNEGWGDFGIVDLSGEIVRGRVALPVTIPADFTIIKATLQLQAMPTYVEDLFNSANNRWRQSRNLRLYHSPGNEGWEYRVVPGGILPPSWRSGTNITSAVLGLTSWSPSLSYTGTDPANSQNKIQYRSGSILSYLTPGETRVFYVETTDTANQTNSIQNVGLGRIVVTIEGYAKPS